jgi:hypothetical protein
VLALTISLLLPWAVGIAWLAVIGWSSPHWSALIGYGYLFGIVVTTLLMRLLHLLGLPQDFLSICLALGGMLLLASGWLSRRWRRLGAGVIKSLTAPLGNAWHQYSLGQRLAIALLTTLILLRLGHLSLEIIWRPLFPWDAVANWAVKARTWFELGTLVPFVGRAEWLSDPSGGVYTIEAWSYPDTIPLIQLWTALALGHWDDTLINLPWGMCAMALVLAFYGQARAWGIGPTTSLLFCYLLVSLPILDASVALAGYADLWLASLYGLAGIALMQWLRRRDRGQAIVALIFAGLCPLIKPEGAALIVTLIPALLVSLLTSRAMLVGGVGLAGGIALWLRVGGFSTELPGLGRLAITPQVLDLPYIGRHELGFHPVWEAFYQSLFVMANWHLFWFLFIAALLIFGPKTLRQRSWLSLHVLIGSQLLLMFAIFFMTQSYQWAESYTSINRVLLHIIPVLLFYTLALLQFHLEQGQSLRQAA